MKPSLITTIFSAPFLALAKSKPFVALALESFHLLFIALLCGFFLARDICEFAVFFVLIVAVGFGVLYWLQKVQGRGDSK